LFFIYSIKIEGKLVEKYSYPDVVVEIEEEIELRGSFKIWSNFSSRKI
jgi:hypothetical protein